MLHPSEGGPDDSPVLIRERFPLAPTEAAAKDVCGGATVFLLLILEPKSFLGYVSCSGFMMTMSMLKQASSKSWLSSKLWLLEFEIVIRRKGCEKFDCSLLGNFCDNGYRF